MKTEYDLSKMKSRKNPYAEVISNYSALGLNVRGKNTNCSGSLKR